MNCHSYPFPLGRMWIAADQGAIVEISWSAPAALMVTQGESPQNSAQGETPLIAEAARQLGEYFEGRRREFDLPLRLKGTDFQRRVWDALLAIPHGEVRTYGEIARAIGNQHASRAVGMACNRNPVSIVVPCHRVVGAGGLTGYAGGLDKKAFLLELEWGGRG
jgi:methylated-DNA-[protein]-cysteine S-methyltransferase